MTSLPSELKQILGEDIYHRQSKIEVQQALIRLDLELLVSDAFGDFYSNYCGSFWEENVPFELLDIVEGNNTIESYTLICRKEHGWPHQFLVLSEMSGNAVLVLDTVTDKVYKVDFEGGEEKLVTGELKESWISFKAFLEDYFNC